jgi:hypothetical protein
MRRVDLGRLRADSARLRHVTVSCDTDLVPWNGDLIPEKIVIRRIVTSLRPGYLSHQLVAVIYCSVTYLAETSPV